uniref:Uncharacterized protein n=1 Tax=Plectus sambesii TaxID=2011161 RepID=A0A914UX64_9BILA
MTKRRAALFAIVVTVIACNVAIAITLRILLEKTDEYGHHIIKDGRSRELVAGFLGVFVMTFCFCCCGCFCCGGRVCGIKDSHELLYVKNWRRKKVDKVIIVSPEKQARWATPRPSIIESEQKVTGYYPIRDFESRASPTISPDVIEENLLKKLHKEIVVTGV